MQHVYCAQRIYLLLQPIEIDLCDGKEQESWCVVIQSLGEFVGHWNIFFLTKKSMHQYY